MDVESKSQCGSGKLVDTRDLAQSVLYQKIANEDCSSTSVHLRSADVQACVLGWIESP